MALRIPSDLAAELLERARSSPGAEVCGALLGRGSPVTGRVSAALLGHGSPLTATVTAVVPLLNAAPHPADHFLIPPDAVAGVERTAAAANLHLLGFFHSHTHSAAVPSEEDTETAWPGWVHLILAPSAPLEGEMRAWTLREDRSGFDPVPLEIG